MSKNIVDSILDINLYHPKLFSFIPSRRQIDYCGGYVNNWNTKRFAQYVNKQVLIQRDHGGPLQGRDEDSGLESLVEDSKYFDLIHVDPWKKVTDLKLGIQATVDHITRLHNLNENIYFEVGTEEAIRRFSLEEFYILLNSLKNQLSESAFCKIKYAVIQSGVGLDLIRQKNIGEMCMSRLTDMISICESFDIMSKEHNGDYLPLDSIKFRFDHGLSGINIAPEFGQVETKCYLEHMSDSQIDKFYNICHNSNKWKKWVDKDFDSVKNKLDIIMISGHYVLSDPNFLTIKPSIDDEIKFKITDKLNKLINTIEKV